MCTKISAMIAGAMLMLITVDVFAETKTGDVLNYSINSGGGHIIYHDKDSTSESIAWFHSSSMSNWLKYSLKVGDKVEFELTGMNNHLEAINIRPK